MAEYRAAERDAGDRTGLHPDLSTYVRERVAAALTAGIDPTDGTAAAILDDLVQRYAETFQTSDCAVRRPADSAGGRNTRLPAIVPRVAEAGVSSVF